MISNEFQPLQRGIQAFTGQKGQNIGPVIKIIRKVFAGLVSQAPASNPKGEQQFFTTWIANILDVVAMFKDDQRIQNPKESCLTCINSLSTKGSPMIVVVFKASLIQATGKK